MATESEETNIYRKLQQHLDSFPIGYPATESGVELRILQHLFTPEEAEIAIFLDFKPEPLKRIFKKVSKAKDIGIEDLETMLDGMVTKGCLNAGKNPETGEKFYADAFLAVGMFEYQLNRLTKEFMEEAFIYEFKKSGVPQLRTIPIEQAIEHENFVASYDDVRHIIETRKPISVAECICRKGKKLLGEGCDKPTETCFQFGTAAYTYIAQGLGREIDKEEALSILAKAQQAGLVLQPGNAQKAGWICCCCGCCCGVLTAAKRLPNPSEVFATNHISTVDIDACIGCGTCVERCPMNALSLSDDNKSVVNQDRC